MTSDGISGLPTQMGRCVSHMHVSQRKLHVLAQLCSSIALRRLSVLYRRQCCVVRICQRPLATRCVRRAATAHACSHHACATTGCVCCSQLFDRCQSEAIRAEDMW